MLTLLGDPHLGKRFVTGVPLHRVGDRERMVWEDFHHSIAACRTPMHVCMGDLFDKFIVAPEVLMGAFQAYLQAPSSVDYIILRGNHDVSRDRTRLSSFDLFQVLVEPLDNVIVVSSTLVLGNMGFVPFDPFKTAEEQVRELPDNLDMVFMHHDFVDFGGDHVIPTKLLAEKGIMKVINGHDHVARTEIRHGVEVQMTGSMQPYSHAEDPDGLWYVTTTLNQLGDVRDKNIRLVLRTGEEAPTDLDCLSLTIVRELDPVVDALEVETFDLLEALDQALAGLEIKDELMEKFRDHSPVS